MDKRLSVALLLTALVVAVTPILFPTPRKTSTVASVVQTDSSLVSSSSSSQTASKPSTTSSQAESVSVPAPVTTAVPAGTVDSLTTVRSAVQQQITAIVTPKAVYRFSNIGASLSSATMRGYKNLATKKGDVELHFPNKALVNFSFVINRDIVNLVLTAFKFS